MKKENINGSIKTNIRWDNNTQYFQPFKLLYPMPVNHSDNNTQYFQPFPCGIKAKPLAQHSKILLIFSSHPCSVFQFIMAFKTSHISKGFSGQDLSSNGRAEGTIQLIIGHKLNGHNHLQWAKSVMTFVSGKGKDNYLIG